MDPEQPEDESKMILQNGGNHLPSETASYPRRPKSSTTLMWTSQNSQTDSCSDNHKLPSLLRKAYSYYRIYNNASFDSKLDQINPVLQLRRFSSL